MEASQEPYVSERVLEISRLPWLDFLGSLIISPGKAFRQLSDRPQWLLPAIFMLLWPVLYEASRFLPFILRPELSNEELSSRWASIVFSLILWDFGTATVVLFLTALLLYCLCRIFSLKPRLYPFIAGLALAEFLPQLAAVSAKLVSGLFSSSPMISIYEVVLWARLLRMFTSARPPIYIVMLFEKIEPFHLWSLALLVIMLCSIARAPLKKAALIAGIAVCIRLSTYLGWIFYLLRFRA